jgi:hypothetical protein
MASDLEVCCEHGIGPWSCSLVELVSAFQEEFCFLVLGGKLQVRGWDNLWWRNDHTKCREKNQLG